MLTKAITSPLTTQPERPYVVNGLIFAQMEPVPAIVLVLQVDLLLRLVGKCDCDECKQNESRDCPSWCHREDKELIEGSTSRRRNNYFLILTSPPTRHCPGSLEACKQK